MSINRAIALLATLALGSFLLLSYGNCQWGKFIFEFQRDVYPGTYPLGLDRPPTGQDFSGSWRTWSKDGNLLVTEYKNGRKHGRSVYYFQSGEVSSIRVFSHGVPVPPELSFSQNGLLRNWSSDSPEHGLCGKRTGPLRIRWDTSGELKYVSIAEIDAGPDTLIFLARSAGGIDRTAEYEFEKLDAEEFMTKHGITAEIDF